MTVPKTEVSIIIPTHNHANSLKRTLDALNDQNFPLEKVEVNVVMDGCIDNTMEMLKNYKASFKLHVIEQWGSGAATARNIGAKSAKGYLLIFLDDDIESLPGLINAHVSAHSNNSNIVAIGYLPAIYPEPLNFYHIEARSWWENKFRTMSELGHRFNYLDLLSGNFSITAKLFAQIRGFDTNFPDCGGEDYEFGVRLIKSGVDFIFVPEAMGYHHDKTDLDRSFKRARKEGQADVMIGKKHPELRPNLFISKIHSPWTRLARIFVKLVGRWPTRGDYLATLLKRLLHLYERFRMRRYWRNLYGILRAYWYWRGALDELGSMMELNQFLANSSLHNTKPDNDLTINLQQGISLAEKVLDKLRPTRIQIRYGQHFIGEVQSIPGAERLRGTHLRPLLVKNFTWQLLIAMATEGTMGSIDNQIKTFLSQLITKPQKQKLNSTKKRLGYTVK